MLTWISILTTHVAFRKACIAQQIPPSHLPCRAPFGVWGLSIALGFMTSLIAFKGAEVFVHGFDCKTFIVQYRHSRLFGLHLRLQVRDANSPHPETGHLRITA
jgi:amino acid permease